MKNNPTSITLVLIDGGDGFEKYLADDSQPGIEGSTINAAPRLADWDGGDEIPAPETVMMPGDDAQQIWAQLQAAEQSASEREASVLSVA